MKFKRGIEMRQQVGNAVAARIKMEFVRYFQRIERFIQFCRPAVETIGVFGAAVKVNLRFEQFRRIFPSQQERAVQIPEFLVDWIAKHTGKEL